MIKILAHITICKTKLKQISNHSLLLFRCLLQEFFIPQQHTHPLTIHMNIGSLLRISAFSDHSNSSLISPRDSHQSRPLTLQQSRLPRILGPCDMRLNYASFSKDFPAYSWTTPDFNCRKRGVSFLQPESRKIST